MNLEELILEMVQQAVLPLKATEIAKRVKAQAGRTATPKVIMTALEALESAGRVNRITAGKAVLFTTQSLEAAAMAMLRAAIHTAKLSPQAAKLRSKLPTALQTHFEAALARLVAQGEAFVMPGAKRFVHAKRPKPSEVLDATRRRALQKIFDVINPLRSSPVSLDEFTAWLDEVKPTGIASASIEVSKSAPIPEAAQLRAWYEEDRLRSSTMMIAIPRTFEKYAVWAQAQGGKADSQLLRNLMEGLYNEGRILLEPCERPQDLPEHERAMLVPMSLGPPGYSWCWIA